MYLKGLFVTLLLFPFLGNAQSISSNLSYINKQFRKYNNYETSFRVDESKKELICEDRFGILKAKFSDIKFDYERDNVGLYCLSDDKCIRYYDKDGTRKYDDDENDYTMGLRKNNELIEHIDDVMEKFAELKRLVLYGSSNYSSSSSSSGNSSIDANLRYINQQFDLYNAYNTTFSIDKNAKELICEDKFGIIKAKWSDIEIKTSSENIGVYCLSDGKCIRYYDKNGVRKYDEDYNNYTMGLRENEKLIPHINKVLNKFAEIKSAILDGESGGSSNSNKAQIDAELRTINNIFKRSSEYSNTYYIDYTQNAIVSKTENCRAIVPVKSGLSVNYYKRTGDGHTYGFYFENSDKSILESCTSFEDYTEKTYEYLANYEDAQTVIRSLKKIINLLENSSSSYGSSSNTSVDSKLKYINQQFANYNGYNTVWSVNYGKKQLIWKNDFGTNYVDFSDLEIRADYENNWIGVYCLTGDKCILQKGTKGNTLYYDQYTMSLNDDGKMISHMNKVINEFAAIKKAVVGNSTPSKPSGGGGSSDDPDGPDK